MKLRKKITNTKMRKGADNSNVALVALAIGVIIIVGMYLFTKKMGDKTASTGEGVATALGTIQASDFGVTGK